MYMRNAQEAVGGSCPLPRVKLNLVQIACAFLQCPWREGVPSPAGGGEEELGPWLSGKGAVKI